MKLVQKPIHHRSQSYHVPTGKYEGSYYAIKTSGGFHISNPMKSISVETIPNLAKYDITDALQIAFPAIIFASFLNNDQIRISSQTFLQYLDTNSILSLGSFENLYSNYESFINDTVGNIFSHTSLFSSESQTIMRPTFGKTSFFNLITSTSLNDGEICSAFSGEMVVFNVERTLADIQRLNVFGNRTNGVGVDQFIPGDFFYLKDGFSITLRTDLSLQPMYFSFMACKEKEDNTNRNIAMWDEACIKTYPGDLLIYLV
jgi:hypothetical protein